MYKTEIISKIKDNNEKALKMSELINKQETIGWDFVNAIAVKNNSVILVFKENPTYKLNQEVNKGINTVKETITKVVDSISKNKN
ncbi:hypothetical protein [Acholeplasma hippikon]|uniref:DUF4177 domain-containing protein n=1 Tax=Acholeplasma hippikon TaxID=264636 RepID=A0A449BIG9_9MOLU|nr:hypothetical protein [Acholeplasma hippikon]VEU82249.1 Uncharacterised protein [Acholeplasma hippikon]